MTTRREQVAALVAQGRDFEARAAVLGNDGGRSYYRDADLPIAPPVVAGAPAAPAPVAAAPVAPVAPPAAPIAGPAPLTFREQVSKVATTDPLAARALLLTNVREYLNPTPPAPVAAPAPPAVAPVVPPVVPT